MKKETVKEVITAGKTHRTGWYFAKDRTFEIPVTQTEKERQK